MSIWETTAAERLPEPRNTYYDDDGQAWAFKGPDAQAIAGIYAAAARRQLGFAADDYTVIGEPFAHRERWVVPYDAAAARLDFEFGQWSDEIDRVFGNVWQG
jgi:hypothetical protein